MSTIAILFLRLFLLNPVQAPCAAHHQASATVTVLDLSGPSAPESEFPTVSKKGSL